MATNDANIKSAAVSQSPAKKHKTLPLWAIVVIAVAALLAVVLVTAALVYFFVLRDRHSSKSVRPYAHARNLEDMDSPLIADALFART